MVVRAPVFPEESIKVDGFARFSVLCPNGMTALHSDLSADLGGRRDISIHAHPPATSKRTYRGDKRRTGAVLVSRCDHLSAVFLSPRFLQTTLAYTPDLGRLAV